MGDINVMIGKVLMEESDISKAKAIKIREFLRMCGIEVNYKKMDEGKDENNIFFSLPKENKDPFPINGLNGLRYKGNLNTVIRNLFTDSGLKPIIEEIKKIYTSNHLDIHIYNTYHFHRITDVIKTSCEALAKAYNELYELEMSEQGEKRTDETKYCISYARIQCAKRINEMCNLLGEKRIFVAETLVSQLEERLSNIDKKACGYYLMGQIYFSEPPKKYLSTKYFKLAQNCGMEDYFQSNICYYIGLNQQAITKQLDENALAYYQEALEKNPQCYRAMYKLGMFYINKKNNEAALAQFEKIISCLEPKNKKYLQPVEIMYLFKAYQRSALALDILKTDNIKAANYKEKAEKILKDENDEWGSAFLADYYGTDKKDYKKYLQKCIQALDVYKN